jgi:hypothetical protein
LSAAGSRPSFTDVVTMSGPPQRPPPVGAFAVGHVRPPPLRQPVPHQSAAAASGVTGVVTRAPAAFGSVGGAPLQPPSRQQGPTSYMPPQQMPFVQCPQFHQFQALPFQ